MEETRLEGTASKAGVLSPGRCEAAIFKRDTYRRTGRGRTGFELHYTEKRCSRRAVHNGFCWQHQHFNDNWTD